MLSSYLVQRAARNTTLIFQKKVRVRDRCSWRIFQVTHEAKKVACFCGVDCIQFAVNCIQSLNDGKEACMFATHLRCLRCGTKLAFDPLAYLCPRCGQGDESGDPGILDVQYDYPAAANEISRRQHRQRQDIFRYLPLLPVERPGDALPAGGT